MANIAKRILGSKYFWVGVVCLIIGASMGTKKTEYIEVERKVEVPVEKVIYSNTDQLWYELKDVDDKIFNISSEIVTSQSKATSAVALWMQDELTMSQLNTIVEAQSSRMKELNNELSPLVKRRLEIVKELGINE